MLPQGFGTLVCFVIVSCMAAKLTHEYSPGMYTQANRWGIGNVNNTAEIPIGFLYFCFILTIFLGFPVWGPRWGRFQKWTNLFQESKCIYSTDTPMVQSGIPFQAPCVEALVTCNWLHKCGSNPLMKPLSRAS